MLPINSTVHEVFFKSLLVDWRGITVMDDKANKIRLPRTGVVSLFMDRYLDKVNPTIMHKVSLMVQVLDMFILLHDWATVIAAGRFLHMSINQALTEAIQTNREAKSRLGS